MNDPVRHWFHGSTFNGQPLSEGALTFCGKPQYQQVDGGDRIVRIGAAHTYFVTCPECMKAMDEKRKECK